MKSFRQIILIAALIFGGIIKAQDFEIPKDYKFEKPEDYKIYTEKIVEGINWLLNSPVDNNKEHRKEVNAFIIKWITGSPDYQLIMDANATPIIEDVEFEYNSDVMTAYIGGMLLHSINNTGEVYYLDIQRAGITAVLKLTDNNKKLMKKSKAVKKYRQLKKHNELNEWILSNQMN